MLFNFASEKLILSTFLQIIFILFETRAIQKGTMTRCFEILWCNRASNSRSFYLVARDRVKRSSLSKIVDRSDPPSRTGFFHDPSSVSDLFPPDRGRSIRHPFNL